ncbi:MAG: DUF4870 domain-containing protein [Fimbriimonadaceae bacterium]
MAIVRQEDKTWGALAHVLPLVASVALGGFGWLVALVIYLVNREKSPFVAFHAYQELWLHGINFLILGAAVIAAMTVILIPLAILLGVVSFVLMVVIPIVGAIQASNGNWYRLPVVGALSKR